VQPAVLENRDRALLDTDGLRHVLVAELGVEQQLEDLDVAEALGLLVAAEQRLHRRGQRVALALGLFVATDIPARRRLVGRALPAGGFFRDAGVTEQTRL